MIDHCVSLFDKQAKEEIYKAYVTDTLKLINENVAKIVGGNIFKTRYSDVVNPQNDEPEKSGDEIAKDIIKRAGLKVKK